MGEVHTCVQIPINFIYIEYKYKNLKLKINENFATLSSLGTIILIRND